MKLVYIFFILSLSAMSCRKKEKSKCLNPPTELYCLGVKVDTSINGFTINYLNSDSTKKISEGNYTKGIPTGSWRFYYDDGVTLEKEGFFDNNGKITGFWIRYFTTGYAKEEGDYKSCSRSGFWKFYFDNSSGQVQYEGHFSNGFKINEWIEYDSSGKQIGTSDCGR